MTSKQINEALIKEVKTAINNVANAYNGSFQVKENDEGTDRVSNITLRLTSNEWKKGSEIKFSIDKPSEFLSSPNDPMYFACCEMGVLLDRLGFDGFAGVKHSHSILGKTLKSVGKFIENLFLPTAIEILKFQKAKKSKVNNQKLKKFFNEMWLGTIKKVPTEEQIADLFDKANESVNEAAKKPSDFIKNIGSKYSPLSDEEKEIVKKLENDLKIDLWYSSFNMRNKWFTNAQTNFKELCDFLKTACGYKLTEEGLKKMIEWLNDKNHSLEAYRDDSGHAIYYADKKPIDDWKNDLLGAKFRNLSNK